MSGGEDGGRDSGGDDDARGDRAARDGGETEQAPRADWASVRSGGRVAFHAVITTATILFCVGGEIAGNLIFRRGAHLGDQMLNAAIFGFLAGNLLAWWVWKKEDAKT